MVNDIFSGWLDEESQVRVPSGEEFQPSGFIGQVMAKMLFSFFSYDDLAQVEGAPKPFYRSKTKKDSYFNYYEKQEEALAAIKAGHIEKTSPQQVWFFQVKTDSILNLADKSKFTNDFVTASTRVTSPRSKKYRHEFHLITLPAAVRAVAAAAGYNAPTVPLNLLTGRIATEEGEQGLRLTDEFRAEMIGNPDEVDFTVIMKSTLGRARAALWAALGESDPTKYVIEDPESKFNTVAPKLVRCLKVAYKTWQTPKWGRLLLVNDPRVDASYEGENGPKHLTIPALTELFASEAEAKAAAQVDLDRQTQNAPASMPVDHPDIPTEWAKVGANAYTEWLAMVQSYIGQHPEVKGKKGPVLKKFLKDTVSPDDYACTPDEMGVWIEFSETLK